ncbi:MAG: hypothetical protein ACI9XO_001319 [Paraglaciecola sp.]|jgi:hypothetical protein
MVFDFQVGHMKEIMVAELFISMKKEEQLIRKKHPINILVCPHGLRI